MTDLDPDTYARKLAAEHDGISWFEQLYVDEAAGKAVVPWDFAEPSRLLADWAQARELTGAGRSALVVGCGFGRDAEYVAGLGFETVAFDIAETGVRRARERHPGSPVRYVVANLLEPPAQWLGGFDLVLESLTVQSMPPELHRQGIEQLGRLVAPGGTLLVLASARADGQQVEGPPWPLTPSEIDAFSDSGVQPVNVEKLQDASDPEVFRWQAEFQRPR